MEGITVCSAILGKKFEEDGPVTVMPENTPAADNQLTAGKYEDAAKSGKYMKEGAAPEGATELVDGVLTVADRVPETAQAGTGMVQSWRLMVHLKTTTRLYLRKDWGLPRKLA